jgi:hypothetical protein
MLRGLIVVNRGEKTADVSKSDQRAVREAELY